MKNLGKSPLSRALFFSIVGPLLVLGPVWWMSIYKPFSISLTNYRLIVDSGGVELSENYSVYGYSYSWRNYFPPRFQVNWLPQKPVSDFGQFKEELGFDFAIYTKSYLESRRYRSSKLFIIAIWLLCLMCSMVLFPVLWHRFRRRMEVFEKEHDLR